MDADDDPYYLQIRREAEDVLGSEPELGPLLYSTVLAPGVKSFEDVVAVTVCYRLLLLQDKNIGGHEQYQESGNDGGGDGAGAQQRRSSSLSLLFSPNSCQSLIRSAFDSDMLELGHTMKEAVRMDVAAVVDRDPAMDTYLEVVLYSKGFASLVCHRAAHRLWVPPQQRQHELQQQGQGENRANKKFTALFLQSQASALFGVDLHPLAKIGSGILLDHGTGIVVGETATIGDGCTILHGVTLGGTGKDHGDRHPKVGKHVLIGAGSSILGNISIGDSAKIGAGSVVLRSIPPFATAVGAPAKVSVTRPMSALLLLTFMALVDVCHSFQPAHMPFFLYTLPRRSLDGPSRPIRPTTSTLACCT
jgi:serine O-acetyltransferase